MSLVKSTQTQIRLYAHPEDHVSHRVRLVLAHKKISHELKLITSEDERLEEISDINPYNKLPLMIDRDLVLFENRVMIDYVEERYRAIQLMPIDPIQRARLRQLAWRLETDWLKLADILLSHSDDMSEPERTQARSELSSTLITAAPLFSQNAYFFSDHFSLCDAILLPVLWRLPEMGIRLPLEHARPVYRYMKQHFESEIFKESIKEE